MGSFRPIQARCLVLGLLLATSMQTLAEDEKSADITGWIDGEEASWIIQSDRLRPSAVFSTITPGLHQLRIYAYQSERYAREGSLYLELVIRDGEVSSSELHHFPFAPRFPRFGFGADHGSGQLILHSLDVQADKAHLAATFAGELYYHQSSNTRPIPHRTLPIRLNINLTAARD